MITIRILIQGTGESAAGMHLPDEVVEVTGDEARLQSSQKGRDISEPLRGQYRSPRTAAGLLSVLSDIGTRISRSQISVAR